LSNSSAPTVQVGQQIYGPVVEVFTFGFWALFGLFCILILWWREVWPGHRAFPILVGLLATFAFGIGASAFSILNAGRAYAIGSILIGTVVAVGLVAVLKRAGNKTRMRPL